MDFELYFVGMRFRNTEDNSGQKELNEYMINSKCNCLLSYTNDKAEIEARFNRPDYKGKLFIDSGAFSLWTQGKEVNVDEYIEFLNQNTKFIDLHGQVDIIPGERGHVPSAEQVEEAARLTWENYLYMRERLTHPDKCLYTFHVDEPYEYLRQALEWKNENGQHIPYIALGGMVGRNSSSRERFLKGVFATIRNSSNPDVKVHAFGMTSEKLLRDYPGITSADSTSWLKFAAYGNIQMKINNKHHILKVGEQASWRIEHPTHLSEGDRQYLDNYLKRYNMTLEELGGNSHLRLKFNVIYNLEMQEWIKEERKKTSQSSLQKLF